MHRRALVSLLVLALALFCAGARADNAREREPEAEALIQRGIELREHGKDDQALELFKKAEALAPSPRAHAQVGLCEQALGIWVPAEAHIEAALAARGDPWIERYRGALATALETVQKHVGKLEVRGGVPGAEVLVDGAKIGTLPMTAPWRVEVGRRALEVRAAGYHPSYRATDIAPSGTTRETIDLVREDAPPSGARESGGEKTPIGVDPSRGAVQRTMGWVFVGTGAALVVTGVAGIVARQSAVSAYNDDTSCPGMGNPIQPASCQDRISSANTWRTISVVAFIAGGLVGVGGAVLLLTGPSPRAAPATARGFSCSPAPLGLSCGGAF